jgi:Reverse transcriptase (RNA-dependent DNA polymerase)
MEKLYGNTPDISMFRFTFWQPVRNYEPTAKYPTPNFLPRRFVGIAWNHGDAFTYKIWTCPDGDWAKGSELIRNVVKPRTAENQETHLDKEALATFELRTKTKKKRDRKRKRNENGDVINPELPGSDADDRVRTVMFGPDQFAPPDIIGNDTDQEEQGGNEHGNSINNNNKSKTSHVEDELDTDPVLAYDPFDAIEEIEMSEEINDELGQDQDESTEISASGIKMIKGHRWKSGLLELQVLWDTELTSWESLQDMKVDRPLMTAKYLIKENVSRSNRVDRTLQWAKKTLRDVNRASRRVARLYDHYLDENEQVYSVRRIDNKKKKRPKARRPTFKYGVEVPRNLKHAKELDAQNGNTFWEEAIKLEITSLVEMECFEFRPRDYKPGDDYQYTTLTIIFDVKQDLRRKARLVAGGHLVDAMDNSIYSSTVKGISVRMIHVIAHAQQLKLLCGDVGNAYVNAYTNELVYCRAGPEFGEKLSGMIVIIRKALYGLRSSSERWWSHFADTIRGLKFLPTRYDKDVWYRVSEDKQCYEYICTHSDDFMIASKKPELVMQGLKEIYAIKSEGPPDYYLGNDYKKDKKDRWCFGCKKYITESVTRIEKMFGTLAKTTIPMSVNDHPETDDTTLLSDDEHRKYQMLIGMLNWVVTIGRFDVAHATMSLSRFSASPRKGHLERALKVFGYLKRRPNRRIAVDSSDPIFNGFEDEFAKDYVTILGEDYPEATEEVDQNLPTPLVDEMTISAFVDSDHAHDKVTRRSVTGLIIFVGRTPIFYMSKRQGAIETSTYGAEFCAMRVAVEELCAVRYMLRSMGVKVEHASYLFGDNLGVVQNATIKDSLLKKKHVAISYHKVREAAASGIVHPLKVDGRYNFADVLTKAQTNKVFAMLVGEVMHG